MLYSVISMILIMLGLYIIFNKKIINTILMSFLLSLFVFIVLMINKLFFLAIMVALIDVFAKIYILIFYINKKEIYRTKSFNRKTIFKKIIEVISITIFLSIGLVLIKNNNTDGNIIEIRGEISESVLLAIVITLFSVAGYVTKSKRWN